MSLIYNPATRQLIDRISDNLPHALLLEGVEGVGLASAARDIAWHDLAAVIQSTDSDGNVDVTTKGIIRIPQIRELIMQTRAKLMSRRVYIIDEADKMNVQAQNAFLKLLEEPVPHVHIILTSHAPNKLLPTVLSRVQRIHMQPITTAESKQLITKHGITDPRTTQQLLFLADGRPAALTRLIDNPKDLSDQAAVMSDARDFIQGAPYQRAMIAMRYASDRTKALTLLASAQAIVAFSIRSNPTPKLVATANKLSDASEHITANGNARLQLMDLVV